MYINPDAIAQERFGDWNSQESVLKAAQFATAQRYECLKQKRDIVFETVFSSEEKIEFIRKAKAEGYFIRFFYVCTDSPEINVSRVAKRYLEGGHEVPISKIISRYYKSLNNAAEAIRVVDRAYLYDNSVENEAPKLLLRTVDGKLFRQYEEEIPRGSKAVMESLK